MANRNILKEVILNQLIKIPFIQDWSNKNGSTGRNEKPEEVEKVYNQYTSYSPDVENKRILELGTGHTFGNLLKALTNGASEVHAVDIMNYVETVDSRVAFKIYNGTYLPYQDNYFDLIWSWTVYEHLRYPSITLPETFRVLKKGGISVSFIDLVDHFAYSPSGLDEKHMFDCLDYSHNIWKAMTWNRSTYVNRLRLSDWIALFEKSGFKILKLDIVKNKEIENMLENKELNYLKKYTIEDAISQNILVVAQKV